MALCCVVIGCSNGSYRLNKWKSLQCEEHRQIHELCNCDPPFKLHPFPTVKKDYELRMKWIKVINRADDTTKGFFEPGRNARVCSIHFKDGEPSSDNPLPVLSMGYDGAEKRALFLSPPSTTAISRKRKSSNNHNITAAGGEGSSSTTTSSRLQQKQRLSSSVIKITLPNPKKDTAQSTLTVRETPTASIVSKNRLSTPVHQPHHPKASTTTSMLPNELESNVDLIITKKTPECIKRINKSIRSSIKKTKMHNSMKTVSAANSPVVKPLFETLLKNNKKCLFYTNITNLELFHQLHNNVKGFVRSRFYAKKRTLANPFNKVHTPKKPGPDRKLNSVDELLLTLMKLRLGLLFEDLGDRFGVSKSCASKIFQSWIRALSLCLRSLIYLPEEENIRNTTPSRFRGFHRLNGIIDCTEVFIETPKSLELQSATWSEYKHHNTAKILISVLPNSLISYVSEPYTGRISDKAIVNETEFLDTLPPYCSLMTDKGFNIEQECAQKSIHLIIPPGRRGTSQMTEAQLKRQLTLLKFGFFGLNRSS
ncbi:uncharacterized protein [Clytia hemisphaerica]|uniref:uncharacterized protein n=1 Tax=Clytia hemisphaerica TaxID=252671 RepID=UPI0034D3A1C1